MYMMAPPSKQHQEIVGAIYAAIREHVRGKKGKCMLYLAPFAVFLTNDESTYVEPDLLAVCDPEKLNDKGCWGTDVAVCWESVNSNAVALK